MAVELKPLSEQVVVITGASSGIGQATAEAAAKAGARVVLAARSTQALDEIVGRIAAAGGKARAVTCDVSDRAAVDGLAAAAVAHFGRIDTWVNNAGLGIYGRLEEVTEADSRRLFDVNFWGVVNGSLAALPHLRRHGGALINVGSEVSEAYMPLMGMYTASKHAVKGFTDALRVEVEDLDKAPVAVTLIQPTAVDTPFPQHARNYQPREAKLPPNQIDPATVAEAILDAAANPTRDRRVGFAAKLNTTMATLTPGVADWVASKMADKLHYDEPPRHPEGTLHQPGEAVGVAGRTHGTGGKK